MLLHLPPPLEGAVSQHAMGWGCVSQHAMGQWGFCLWVQGVYTPLGKRPLGKKPLVEMIIEAGDTHSIRMHSCSNLQPLV